MGSSDASASRSAASAFVSGAVALIKAAHPGLTPAQIKQLLEDTARNPPAGGRDDSRGFGMIDPAAAIKAAGRLKPNGLQAVSYGDKYFGPGPDESKSGDGTSGWAAPLAGSLGGVLLVAAVFLWRGRRPRFDGF